MVGIVTPPVACIAPVHIQMQEDMVGTVMIVMRDVMEVKMKTVMVMAENENGVTEMMMYMVEMGTLIVVMLINMEGTMRTATAEMGIGMMITVEEVKLLIIINMDQEVGALIDIRTEGMKMMANTHPGFSISLPSIDICVTNLSL